MWCLWIYALRARLRSLVRPERTDRELRDELSFHVAMQARVNERQGMSPSEAERRARLDLGGVQQLKERLHERRSITWLDHLRQDLRYAVRTLLRTKIASLAVIATFALGIGANTAMFSLIDAVLLSPLPYDAPDRIVTVEPFWTNRGETNTVSSAPDFRDWRRQNRVFEYLGYHNGREVRVAANGTPMFAAVQLVTAEFFAVFGMVPARGRTWTEGEEHAPLAVVSHAWATQQFGDAGAALGETIDAVGQGVEIVGVAPPRFSYPDSTDIWVPNTLIPTNPSRGGHNYLVVGRLKPGVTIEEARTDMRAIAARLEQEYPENRFKSVAVTPMLDKLTSRARTTMWLLFAVVAAVLLIACVNVAHLQLARSAARGREMAVRSAIGAGRGRIARQVLTENIVLGLAGSLVGVFVGWLTLRAFLAIAPADIPRLHEVRIDAPVLLFTLAVTVLCSLLFGVGPARRAAQSDVSAALRPYAGRGGTAGVASRVRSTLVVAEVAISLVLLVASGLLLRSFARLSDVDLGFSTDRLLVTETSYPIVGPTGPTDAVDFYRDLLQQVKAIPGVSHAAAVMTMPFAVGRATSRYTIDGARTYLQGEGPIADIQVLTPGYFAVVNTPIRRGRDFGALDERGRSQVAIVNERLAREAFGDDDPLGRVIRTGMTLESQQGMEIVGVVADARQRSPDTPARPEIYLPYRQHPGPGARLSLLTRTSLEPGMLTGAIRETVRKLNPGVPIRFSTMEDVFDEALSYPRFRTVLVAAFALVAVLLALVGIYSVLSYLVAEQTPEIGVRLALGAFRCDIFKRVIAGSMRLVFVGVVIGLGVSLIAVQALEAMLFDISSRDPLTFAGVIALLAVTALTASGIPALRAASVDPLVALRDE